MELFDVDAARRRFIARSTTLAAAAALGPHIAMAGTPPQARGKVFVQGHYRPTHTELTTTRLSVEGAIPPELAGLYVRNGHNPKPDLVPPFWFGGNGMLHGVRLAGGEVVGYRNRWVQTPALHGAPLMRADGSMDLSASAAATSVYAHAGRIYALQEVNLPYLVDKDLATVGVFDFGGRLQQPMTAHPKIDRATGEMLFISYSPVPPHLTYFAVSSRGELVHSEAVPGAGPSIMHDFAVTPNHVLFLDPSVVHDADTKLPFPYRWDGRRQARLGVMPRDRGQGPVRWYPVDPFFYFHVSNAWEEADGTLRMEATHYDEAAWGRFGKWLMDQPGHPAWLVQGDKFVRWHIDPRAGTARPEVRHDVSYDFPTINPTVLGRRNRYTYAAGFPRGPLKAHAIVKFDGQTGQMAVREFPAGQLPGEPWFVPAAGASDEDAGWLFSYVSDLATRRSALHILDATNLRARPVAIVHLPGWVPAGVHGSWISDAELAG